MIILKRIIISILTLSTALTAFSGIISTTVSASTVLVDKYKPQALQAEISAI